MQHAASQLRGWSRPAARRAEKAFDLRAEQPISGGPPASCYERHGCELNRLSVDELFERYMQTGFIYRDKLQRLAPFTDEILENWRRASASPDGLLRVVTFSGEHERSWASLATWRHTETGWCTQHLVSRGDPFATRAVMLAEQEAMLEDTTHLSNQNWFRPENRMPRRVFGAIIPRLGAESACANRLAMFEVKRRRSQWTTDQTGSGLAPTGLRVGAIEPSCQAAFVALAVASRGPAHVAAEGLADADLSLSGVDRLYRKVGLFRYRRVWLATRHDLEAGDVPIAALVAHRGPLGLNYSFIENRADLIAAPDCSPAELNAATAALLDAAAETYADFGPDVFPLLADQRSAAALAQMGWRPVREYCQTLWLRSGYARYQTHLHATFARVAERAERKRRRRQDAVPLEAP